MTHFPRAAGRTALAASAAAFLAFGLAAPAAADPAETYEGSVRAQYLGNAETGTTVRMNGSNAGTNLFELELEDGTLIDAYCIDLETGIRPSAWYKEDAWANYPGEGDFAEPGKVRWILQNSYPSVSAAALAEAAGLTGGSASRFGAPEALAATQAAIWHFSNGAELTARDPGGIEKVYTYLVENAEDLPQEPGPALSVTPETASGAAGGTVGEFTIETNASAIEVVLEAPPGVELVDLETGESVETVDDGDTVGFSVPAGADAGEASFSLEATATVATGRLFKGESDEPTQTLITAGDRDVTVSASASASWEGGGETAPPTEEPSEGPTEQPSGEPTPPESPAPSPSVEPSDTPSAPVDDSDRPSLPVTGGALAGLVAAGIAALGAGGGAIYLSRKRKAAANAADLDA
ncbi:thioester domain-containing protein [Nocardiopsis tropica]|uniref:Thioester domain-containing protein n=1 Tax=Nocardiopsis tropica TaxID=109330 RepID=A0ABU7KNR3_9ACTN|nr:thioester domain-containing protein [Nocardiopsis umidischolae]MEE2050918.1 thioester domain-containing protein [Nocardiopsis umidischolae]